MSVSTFEDAKAALKALLMKYENRRAYKRGLLGDGSGTVDVENRPGYNWVRIDEDTSKAIPVFNQATRAVNDLPVIVGETAEHPGLLQVLSVDWTLLLEQWEEPYVAAHGKSHMRVTNGDDPVDITWEHIIPLSTIATCPESMQVVVQGERYIHGGTLHTFNTTTSADMTSYVPSSGMHKYVLISINTETNLLQYTEGDAVVVSLPAPVPDLPARALPVSLIYLKGDDTTITNDMIYDYRTYINAIGAASWCNVWVVAQCGGDFDNLEDAFNAASDGDVILIAPGTYAAPSSLVTKSLTFVSFGSQRYPTSSGATTITGTFHVHGGAAAILRNLRFEDYLLVTDSEVTASECEFVDDIGVSGASDIGLVSCFLHTNLDCGSATVGEVWLASTYIGATANHGALTLWTYGSNWTTLSGSGTRHFLDMPSRNTWLVGNGHGAHFATIAEAHNHASVASGDVLLVYPGTYDGFTVTKNLSVIGMGTIGDPSLGDVMVSGLTTQLNVQAESLWKNIVFTDDEVAVNTTATVIFDRCYHEYSVVSGAYDVDLEIRQSTLYGVDCSAATGGEVRVHYCHGRAGIGAFEAAHGAADLYLGDAEVNESLLSGTGERYTIPDVHVEKTADTSSPVEVMNWRADSTATPAAGFGVRHKFSLESGSGEGEDAAAIDVVWEDAGAGTEDSAIVDYIRISGAALTEARRLNEKGVVLPSGFDFYPDGDDEFGLYDRCVNHRNTPVTHFLTSSAPLSNWAGAPFGGTPSTVDFNTPSCWHLYHNVSSTRFFAYENANIGPAATLLLCLRAFCGPFVSAAGIRADDGTDDNYWEVFIRTAGAGNGLCSLYTAYNTGGAGRVETARLSTVMAAQFFDLRLSGSTTGYTYYNLSAPFWSYLGNVASGRTWTITRVGIIYTIGTAGSSDRAIYADWYYSNV